MATNHLIDSSSSLIARAGQTMAVIIMLGIVSMVSSMLVTESLDGDAAQINKAGALRMQAVRISRAYFVNNNIATQKVNAEIAVFDEHLTDLFSNNQLDGEQDTAIAQQYQKIKTLWQTLSRHSLPVNTMTLAQSIKLLASYDKFVSKLDVFVSLLQRESEKKLGYLRLIQEVTLFLVIAVLGFVLIKLHHTLIMPLKQLVNVAEQLGKGNFDVKANYKQNDELGVLANTIDQMSSELKLTYQEYEQRVSEKTLALTRSNQSLDILYRAARNLAGYTLSEQDSASFQIDHQIIEELEQLIGVGKIAVKINDVKNNNLVIDVSNKNTIIDDICFNYHEFVLEKQGLLFGYLLWETPKKTVAYGWQKQILQGMADIIATAIELDQKRSSEKRLVIVEERAVIARELHDSLAQSLSYLKVQMSLLTRKMQKQLPQAQVEETIDDIKAGLNSAYLQLRELLTTFRLQLDDPSIKNALSATITEFTAKCQHPIEFNYQLPDNYLSANQEIHLLQIIREALSNIHRHAQATLAGVEISLNNSKISVNIWDNGKGLPEPVTKRGHFGISIMAERAMSLGTEIHLTTRGELGTLVSFEFTH